VQVVSAVNRKQATERERRVETAKQLRQRIANETNR
jgi:hypothetical protein